MINSIPKIEAKTLKTFGQVTQKQSVSDYWLPAPSQDKFENSNTDIKNGELSASKIRIITPEEARKTNNLKVIGLSIAGTVLLSAAGIFFVMKGGGKGLTKNFQKLRDNLQKKIQHAKLNNENNVFEPNKLYICMVKVLDSMLQRSEAINNFTSFKDMLFKNLMNVTKITGKVHDNITRLFEKIGRQTVLNGYKKTSGCLDEAIKLTKSSSHVSGSRAKTQLLEQAQHMTEELAQIHNGYFETSALNKRYYNFKKAAQDLKVAFEKMKVFLTKDLFTKFLADSKISKEKIAMQNSVHGYRREISYSVQDLAKDSDDLILKLSQLIPFKDTNKIKLLASIRSNIKKYSRDPVKNISARTKALKEIDKFVKEIKTVTSQDAVLDKHVRSLTEGMETLRVGITDFKQGKVQDILEIYKKALPEKEYKKIEKAFKHYTKSLDSSIKVETEDFISKLRDLSLGSAPTDILSLLGGLGVLGYHLGKSEDNDQRVSIALKYGIPALSLIGVSLYCNAKLYAGTKGLLIGTVASAVLNRIGSAADSMLKKHRKSKAEDSKNPPKNV